MCHSSFFFSSVPPVVGPRNLKAWLYFASFSFPSALMDLFIPLHLLIVSFSYNRSFRVTKMMRIATLLLCAQAVVGFIPGARQQVSRGYVLKKDEVVHLDLVIEPIGSLQLQNCSLTLHAQVALNGINLFLSACLFSLPASFHCNSMTGEEAS